MRIGFDITPVSTLSSGVGAYAANLLASLQNESQADDTIVPLSHLAQNGNGAPHPGVNKTLWMQTWLPFKLARERIDICHFTNSVATLLSPCPTVVTIHDMTLWLFPQHHYRRRLLAMRPFIPLAARRAAAVIAVSHATKADIVRILGVAADKVHVIHEAPAAWFRPIEDQIALGMVRRRYGLPERIVLYVGTIEPRKNLVRLLEAFASLRHGGVIDHTLVLAGQPGWKHEPVATAVEQLGLSQAVRFLGYVPTDDLVALYNLADALVFPSLYEGFGLPVVEAMACGTPVLTSANSSLAEISDLAAELVDPTSIESLANGLRRILTDPARRAELRDRGLARAAQFTWADAAQQTRAVYAEAIALR